MLYEIQLLDSTTEVFYYNSYSLHNHIVFFFFCASVFLFSLFFVLNVLGLRIHKLTSVTSSNLKLGNIVLGPHH